jgi:hypothetical protein
MGWLFILASLMCPIPPSPLGQSREEPPHPIPLPTRGEGDELAPSLWQLEKPGSFVFPSPPRGEGGRRPGEGVGAALCSLSSQNEIAILQPRQSAPSVSLIRQDGAIACRARKQCDRRWRTPEKTEGIGTSTGLSKMGDVFMHVHSLTKRIF